MRWERTEGIGLNARYCLACSPRPLTPNEQRNIKEEIQSMVWAGGLGLMLILVSGAPSMAVLPAMFVSAPLVLIVHEFAHALTGRLVGFQAIWIQFGHGPVRWRWRMWGFGVEVRRYAWGSGLTHFYDPDWGARRLRAALVDVAGVAVNLALAVGCLMLGARLDDESTVPSILVSLLGGFGLANALCAVLSLYPSGPDADGHCSDGRNLLTGLFGKLPAIEPKLDLLIRAHQLMQAHDGKASITAARDALARYPQELYHLSCAVHWLSRCENDAAALAFAAPWRPMLDGPNPEQNEELAHNLSWARANTAWCGVKRGLSNETWVARDVEGSIIDDNPPPEMRLTRGAWLIETGRVDEGVPLLAAAVRQVGNRIDKRDACGFLAKAEHAAGNIELAQEYEAIQTHLARGMA